MEARPVVSTMSAFFDFQEIYEFKIKPFRIPVYFFEYYDALYSCWLFKFSRDRWSSNILFRRRKYTTICLNSLNIYLLVLTFSLAIFIQICKWTLEFSFSAIYNLSFESDIFPNKWKLTDVVAVFKKGNKSNVANYRPAYI